MTDIPAWFPHDVSRETLDALHRYGDLLRKWTSRINLVSPSTLPDLMTRHVWDSAQIYVQAPGKWVDFGSGGGLPGIVIAILRKAQTGNPKTYLIESDQRKATFLRTCIRELDLNAEVVAKRIEETEPQNAAVLSARALAPLSDLLALATNHLHPDGFCLFQKGASWEKEVEQARNVWHFALDVQPSKTDAQAAVLKIQDIRSV